MKTVHVVAAVIYEGEYIVLARRPDHLHKGGLWEFPGGKVEQGESVETALIRELEEELNIVPTAFSPLIQIPHQYPDKSILLDVWAVTEWHGDLHGKEGQPVTRVFPADLNDYEFPEANVPIITACQLSDRYLVTPDLPEGTDDFIEFLYQLVAAIDSGSQFVQLRQTQLDPQQYRKLATEVIRICRQKSCQVLLNAAPELVEELGADGVHLNQHRAKSLDSRPLDENYLVGVSCHDETELKQAASLGADFGLLGPVQATRTHPENQGMGWEGFNQMVKDIPMPVYAIGGMVLQDIPHVRRSGGQGIAAISALWSVGD